MEFQEQTTFLLFLLFLCVMTCPHPRGHEKYHCHSLTAVLLTFTCLLPPGQLSILFPHWAKINSSCPFFAASLFACSMQAKCISLLFLVQTEKCLCTQSFWVIYWSFRVFPLYGNFSTPLDVTQLWYQVLFWRLFSMTGSYRPSVAGCRKEAAQNCCDVIFSVTHPRTQKQMRVLMAWRSQISLFECLSQQGDNFCVRRGCGEQKKNTAEKDTRIWKLYIRTQMARQLRLHKWLFSLTNQWSAAFSHDLISAQLFWASTKLIPRK